MSKKSSLTILALCSGVASLGMLLTANPAFAKGGGGGGGGGGGNSPTTKLCSAGSVMAAGSLFSDCRGAFSGNDDQNGSGALLDLLKTGEFKGLTDWTFVGKSDSGTAVTAPNAGTSGNWSVAQPLTGPFVVSLKAGDFWSAYFFDNIESVSGGTWNTLGIASNNPALSHMTVYRANVAPTPPAPTPPAPTPPAPTPPAPTPPAPTPPPLFDEPIDGTPPSDQPTPPAPTPPAPPKPPTPKPTKVPEPGMIAALSLVGAIALRYRKQQETDAEV